MTGATLTGVVGQIKWSYYVAAAINGYAVTRTGKGESAQWSLRGTIVNADAYKMAQRPLHFVAPHQKGEWRWQITSHDIQDGTITATLGQFVEHMDKR